MTDLEMTRLCAEAAEVRNEYPWDPLHDDAQAMALVKKFDMVIERDPNRSNKFGVSIFKPESWKGGATLLHTVRGASDLNRAIVECVAKMRATDISNRDTLKKK